MTVNILISSMSTVDKEMNMEAILAIMNTIQVVVKIRFKIKLKVC